MEAGEPLLYKLFLKFLLKRIEHQRVNPICVAGEVKRLGIPDHFIEHGEQKELYEECGFSPKQIAETAVELLTEKKKSKVS